MDTLDALYREHKSDSWFSNRLVHVRTFVLNFCNKHALEAPSLAQLDVPFKQEYYQMDWLATAFHWLMRTGLPNFSPLQLIELRITGSLFEWDFSISYLLEHFKHVDYYLVYSAYAKDFKMLEEKGRSKQLLIYNNLKGLCTNSLIHFIGRLSNMLELPSSLEIFCLNGLWFV